MWVRTKRGLPVTREGQSIHNIVPGFLGTFTDFSFWVAITSHYCIQTLHHSLYLAYFFFQCQNKNGRTKETSSRCNLSSFPHMLLETPRNFFLWRMVSKMLRPIFVYRSIIFTVIIAAILVVVSVHAVHKMQQQQLKVLRGQWEYLSLPYLRHFYQYLNTVNSHPSFKK